MPDDRNEPRQTIVSAEKELSDLQKASAQLKTRIAEARVRHDMAVDPALGDAGRDQEPPDVRNDARPGPSH